MEIPTKYNPEEVEDKWYNYWIDKNYFRADVKSKKEPFCIVIPPPNVTGSLHMGHALNNTLQDILTRWNRMQEYNVLWLPGTDHAGIATQNVVEKELAKEGLTRQELGRVKFVERVWKWKEETGGTIINQLKKLGCSCDWSRTRFTMDEGLSKAVQEVFISLYNEGFIYRGNYIINWCPRCQTALSDLEAEHKDVKGHLYYVKYPFMNGDYIVVATTRPETIFADLAIAVNPQDKRYKNLIGKKVRLPAPCGDREIPIIADDYVDIKFGTGCLKITPAHDPADFEIGNRHNLEAIKVIGPDGKMNEQARKYKGLDRFECRKVLVDDLKREGYIEKIEGYKYSIGSCYRCHTYVEPYLSRQWFVRMKELAKPALKAVKDGKVKFVPKNWEKTYFQWMENIRDWCISRQIWWGHRIPVWYCENENCAPIASRIKPDKCPKCGGDKLTQDEDVLDTWFSSALWPFSTLGWPDKTEDLQVFYPTSVLSTGFDIIFFWVARMIIMGLHFMGDAPFSTVYIHALIRDIEGQKMSKSKGNVIDPLAVIDNYGTDALRFTLAALAVKGRDIYLSEERIQGYRNFMNKIWNASRFIIMNLATRPTIVGTPVGTRQPTLADKWIISRLNQVTKEVTNYLNKYDFDKASLAIYEFFWHEFCDWYLEIAKLQIMNDARRMTLSYLFRVLEQSLRLMHPFIPFITEEIWQTLQKTVKESKRCSGTTHPSGGYPDSANCSAAIHRTTDQKSIMISEWPQYNKKEVDNESIIQMDLIKAVVFAIRNIRSELNIPPATRIQVVLNYRGAKIREGVEVIKSNAAYVKWLAGVEDLKIGTKLVTPRPAAMSLVKGMELSIPLKGLINLEKEKERLQKEAEKAIEELSNVKINLSNKAFIKKAPSEIVAREKERKIGIEARLHKLSANLKMLVLSWFIFLFCFIALDGMGYYENLAGKMFQVKGEVVGTIKEEVEITLILKTDKNENVLIQLDDEKFKSLEGILSSGNWVRMVVKILEGGIIQGISAQKIPRVVSSKKPLTSSILIPDFNILEIYKKTVQYFNPKLTGRDAERIASSILVYSKSHNVDPRLIVAVIAIESDFQVDACSVKGALGLGQLMPQTARILKVNPLNIEENILGTASYLKFCLEQWKDYPYLNLPLALASYNAGPGAVIKYGGIPPYLETQNYVRKVMDLYEQLCKKTR